jgi:hypothetical protein
MVLFWIGSKRYRKGQLLPRLAETLVNVAEVHLKPSLESGEVDGTQECVNKTASAYLD